MEKWYHINGSIRVNVDEDTFNKLLLEFFESKGWLFSGITHLDLEVEDDKGE